MKKFDPAALGILDVETRSSIIIFNETNDSEEQSIVDTVKFKSIKNEFVGFGAEAADCADGGATVVLDLDGYAIKGERKQNDG